jgi:hypothetical protein
MHTETVIYEPPKDGLPYLVVTLSPDGMNVLIAKSRTEARAMVSERTLARRRQKDGWSSSSSCQTSRGGKILQKFSAAADCR